MTIKSIINKYFECINNENFDELFGLFCEDMKFSCPVDFTTQHPEKIKAFYLKVPENYPEHLDTPVKVITEDNRAAVLIQFEGKNASGKHIDFNAVDWFKFKEDRIKSLQIFYDSLGLSRRLKS